MRQKVSDTKDIPVFRKATPKRTHKMMMEAQMRPEYAKDVDCSELLPKLVEEITWMRKHTLSVNKQIKELRGSLGFSNKRITELEAENSANELADNAVDSSIIALTESMNKFAANFDSNTMQLSQRISAMSESIASINRRLIAVENGDNLTDKRVLVDIIDNMAKDFDKKLMALEKRIHTHQHVQPDTQCSHKTDTSCAQEMEAQAKEAMEILRKEMSHKFTEIVRWVKREVYMPSHHLQEKPPFPGNLDAWIRDNFRKGLPFDEMMEEFLETYSKIRKEPKQ